jgi:methionyl-tRNA formyltransferase
VWHVDQEALTMRVAFFGSGSPLSVIVLRALARHHHVTAVVHPERRLGRRDRLRQLFGRLQDDPLTELAKELQAAILCFQRGHIDEVRGQLLAGKADLIAVASFPARIPAALLSAAALGGVNVHQSLLPRGRGPDPLFWSYYNDERQTGSTVHWLSEAFDGGDIIAQQSMPIARGRPNTELYYDLAELGARQLPEAISAIEAGTALRQPQDESLASYQPSPLKTAWTVPFDVWTAERTWHFLAGVGDMFGTLARDPHDNPLPLGAAKTYSIESHGRAPGTYERNGDSIRLYCPDGVVEAGVASGSGRG